MWCTNKVWWAPANICRSLPPLLPPRRNCPSLLHSIDWLDICIVGSNHSQLDGSCCYVLVLLPECPRYPNLVEGMDHPSSNHPIRHWSWYEKPPTPLLLPANFQSPGFVYFASYTYFTSTYFQWMPNAGKCAGEEFAAFAGMGIISSYLILFISFYFATYKKDGKRPTGRKAARSLKDAQIPDVATLTNGKINPGTNGYASTSTTSSTPRVTRSRKA